MHVALPGPPGAEDSERLSGVCAREGVRAWCKNDVIGRRVLARERPRQVSGLTGGARSAGSMDRRKAVAGVDRVRRESMSLDFKYSREWPVELARSPRWRVAGGTRWLVRCARDGACTQRNITAAAL